MLAEGRRRAFPTSNGMWGSDPAANFAAQFLGSGTEIAALGQLVLALVLGAIIGIERSLAGKSAGMRTYGLVAMGACLLTVMSVLITSRYLGFAALDLFRIVEGIIVGIGFIGTGLIVLRGSHPTGLTTAAGIWVAAAVGVAVGFELYILAVGTTFLTILIFAVLWWIEEKLERRFATAHRARVNSAEE